MATPIIVEDRPNTHILDFFHDDEDSSALTALVNGVRFHIILDAETLRKAGHEPLLTEYLLLLQSARKAAARSDDSLPKSNPTENGDMKEDDASSTKASELKDDADSAIDLSADRMTRSKSSAAHDEATPEEAELEIQNWMLSFFEEETAQFAPPPDSAKEQSLHDWYNATTYFFDFHVQEDQLVPRRLEEAADLQARMKELVPHMEMPKYIQKMDVPWVKAKDITVVSEVTDPEPVHPGVVRVGDELQFFKPVDSSQPQPTKREIKILQEIQKQGLRDQIRCPRLLGFVAYENSSTTIMGLLLTHIPEPRPLTTLLSSEVPEDQRLRWADESKEIVKLLHAHGITWGDAKADNLLVDKDDNLWIIDFGGSYTEGWVDPEIAETKEGDNVGLEKTINALVDPDENTFDPEDEDGEDSDYQPQPRKRRRSGSESDFERGQKKSREG
jgi:tRNA A-37 threonylcarbamoyl transferase component Bud32